MNEHILIIGGGSIGERHLRNFLRHDGVRCSLAEPNAARGEELTAGYRIQALHPDWETVDLADVAGIVIATPTHLHAPMLDRLADAGCGILCEKPLAISADGLDDLSQRLRTNDTLVEVGFCYRHHAGMEELKQRIDNGDLGTVSIALGWMTQHWPAKRTPWPPQYAMRRETGGGVILDHMVHWINLLEWLLGPATSVAAFQRHFQLPDIPTEDFGTVTLRFGEDCAAMLTTCMFQHNTQACLQVVGRDATAVIDLADDRLRLYRTVTPAREAGPARNIDRDEMYYRQAGHFLACLQGKAAPHCSFDEAARTLRTVLAAVASSDQHSGFVDLG